MTATVSIITLGCKVNYADSEEITKILTDRGYRVIHGLAPADVSIINTCVVTGRAAYQSRQAIRRVTKVSPGTPIVVTGCAATVFPDRTGREVNVSAVIAPHLNETIGDIVFSLIGAPIQAEHTSPGGGRTRAFLKIQQGCNARCTYCIVPAARGPERSVPPEEVRRRVEGLVERGYREIILVGIHLGRYGNDLDSPVSLARLLRSIPLDLFPARIRLSSIEPMELTDELVSVMVDSPAIAPHLHIPLQSGDDTILAAMGRPYNGALFERVVGAASRRLGGPALGVDVMVGFPGEGEKEFEHTVELIERLPVTYLHVFPFSRRPGTPAFSMEREVPGDIKKERARIARELGRRKKEEYINRWYGKEVTVLIEECGDGIVSGKSENYLKVYLPGSPDDINRFVGVIVDRAFRDGVYGCRRP